MLIFGIPHLQILPRRKFLAASISALGLAPMIRLRAQQGAANDEITKNKCGWQTGSMQRSMGEFRRFRALIQNNTIGKFTRVECGTPSGMSVNQHLPEDKWAEMIGKPPAHLDWAGYCGPVKDVPYHPMIHPWNWRWHTSFGGGQLLDWVGHHVDIALWSLGLDRTGPVKVEGSGTLADHKLFNVYVNYA